MKVHGNVVVTFAMLSKHVIVSVGASVEYSMENRMKETLDSYADAAE